MNRPNAAQLAQARRLLAHELSTDADGGCATATARICEKLQLHLGPLLGVAGVQALLVRSGKLAQRDFPFVEVSVVDATSQLRECLRAQETVDPDAAVRASAALFASFFMLLTTFIGERLTTQAMRRAWPSIEASGIAEPTT